MSIVGAVYHKKHFYKVTWERSDTLLKEVPWLKRDTHDFCIVGYREPCCIEAEEFIGDIMYNRLFDTVRSVAEITKEEALRDFQMDDWRFQKAFGTDEIYRFRSLVDRLELATSRSEVTTLNSRDKERNIEI